MAKDYCTTTEIKAVMPDTSMGSTYDTYLAVLATRASRAIDAFSKRIPGAYYADTDSIKYFDGSGTDELLIDEMASAPTSVEVSEDGSTTLTVWSATDYYVYPYNSAPYWMLKIDRINGSKSIWTPFPKGIKITGKFGYSIAIPDLIKEISIIQAIRYFKRGQQGFSDVGAISDLGQLNYVQKLDPDIASALYEGGFMRITI